MSSKTIKAPGIRFAGYTDPWEQRKLGDVADRYDNLRIPVAANLRVPGSTPYYGANGIQDYVEGYTHEGEFVLVAEDGANDLKNYPVKYVKGRIWVNNHAHVVQGKKDECDNKFLAYSINRANIESLLVGGGRAKLNAEVMMGIDLLIPDYEEQKQIGVYFEEIDNLITLHQRKYDLFVTAKKNMLEKMFSKDGSNYPEIRFAGFKEIWEERRLGEISEKVTEKNKSNKYSETLTNSAEHGIISQRDFFDKDISNEKNLDGYYVVGEDDFVYNPRISSLAPVGPIKRNKLGRTGVMSPLYYVFRTHNIDNTFLEYYFEATSWHKFMRLNGDSGARADRFAIKDSVFTEMPIPYPTLAEQKLIGEFFDLISYIITLQQREVESLKKIKRTLQQQMFV